MNHFISFQTYFLFNVAIVMSYIMTRAILKLPFITQKISQMQQLQFSRKILITTILVFCILPICFSKIHIAQDNHFQLQPIIKHASKTYLQSHETINSNVEILQSKISLPSLYICLSMLFFSAFLIFLKKYIKDNLILFQLKNRAHGLRKIKNLSILISDSIQVPFCWSFMRSHYVLIPNNFLEKNSDLKLAIRHELQHIRQGDTYWLHFFAFIKLICFWNPFVNLWRERLGELQEFACDETLILRQKTSRLAYAQCLLDAVSGNFDERILPQGALGIFGLSKNYRSILNRRITMLFGYKNKGTKKIILICTYIMCFLLASTFAYALTDNTSVQPITLNELNAMAKKSHLPISITPESVAEINNIRGSEQARRDVISTLARMKKYSPYIETQLKENGIPRQLLALPFVESGYRPLDESQNRMRAAGIWQFIPNTAKRFGLTITSQRDDRLNTELATKAAVSFLNLLHAKYQDWTLSVIAYEYGDEITDRLVKKVGSHDAWVLARSSAAPKDLKKFLMQYETSVIMISYPELLTKLS